MSFTGALRAPSWAFDFFADDIPGDYDNAEGFHNGQQYPIVVR